MYRYSGKGILRYGSRLKWKFLPQLPKLVNVYSYVWFVWWVYTLFIVKKFSGFWKGSCLSINKTSTFVLQIHCGFRESRKHSQRQTIFTPNQQFSVRLDFWLNIDQVSSDFHSAESCNEPTKNQCRQTRSPNVCVDFIFRYF